MEQALKKEITFLRNIGKYDAVPNKVFKVVQTAFKAEKIKLANNFVLEGRCAVCNWWSHLTKTNTIRKHKLVDGSNCSGSEKPSSGIRGLFV